MTVSSWIRTIVERELEHRLPHQPQTLLSALKAAADAARMAGPNSSANSDLGTSRTRAADEKTLLAG